VPLYCRNLSGPPRSWLAYSKRSIEKTFASARLANDTQARSLISCLSESETVLGIETGTVYYDFPLFRDSADRLHRADILLTSRSHGVVLFATLPAEITSTALAVADDDLSQLQSIIFGKTVCLSSRSAFSSKHPTPGPPELRMADTSNPRPSICG
jgi:hypothetical protein